MPYRRKKMHHCNTHLQRRWRLRSRTRDLDQIDGDIKTNSEALINQDVDFDKPGFAQHYCVHCSKYFINDSAMQDHFRTKVHKRRLKALELEPYSVEEAERAAGHGSYANPLKRKLETQPTKEELSSGKKIVIETVAEEIEVDEEPRKKKKSKMEALMECVPDILKSMGK